MVAAVEFVIDASFAIPWIFRDEANALSDGAWKKLIEKTVTAHVPALWGMEMVNVSLRGPREGKPKPTEKDVAAFFSVLSKMPLRVHHQGLEAFLEQAPELMRKHKLTAYDSAYLMLALSSGLPLATRDKRMKKAAKNEGVEIFE